MTGNKTMRCKLKATSTLLLLILLLAATCGTSAFAQTVGPNCGPLRSRGQFGPYDYRTERGEPLQLVEGAHFSPEIEALIRGNRERRAAPDIDYTLRAFPNHPRALTSMMRLGERENRAMPDGSRYTVECWFKRAVAFRPDDTTVRMLYATYLYKNNRQPEALADLAYATELAKDNGFTHYNIGLVYFEMKVYDKALASAHRAMELGFDQTELRDLLKQAGHWQEPSVAATAPQ
jgi:tetratricopeptide (TPR) repeat protein